MPVKAAAMSTVQSGKIQFVEGCPPPLEAGNYRITVTQTVDAATGGPFDNTYDFAVRGPRFVLEPACIHAFFPPPGHQGNFSETLPQVVFNRRTLPWERTLDGSQPPAGTVAAPWMGLLLVDESDGQLPQVQTGTVGALLPAAQGGSLPGGFLGPAITKEDLEPGESLTDACLMVDLPAPLFQRIAPALGDLPFLAHARQVEAPTGEPSWFSMVMGNRFPHSSAKNTVFLVSLEGFQDHLPGAPSQGQTVRLACLASWSFVNSEGKASFQELMAGLHVWQQNGQPIGRLNLPPATEGGSGAQKFVENALEMGYVALHHTTRQGEKTISWNRGPLVPLRLEPDQPTTFATADAALRYDPKSGMFDVSYAAAWQLGRLLALQDPAFATALLAWRRQNLLGGARAVTHNLLAEKLGSLFPIPAEIPNLFDGHSLEEPSLEEQAWRYLRSDLLPRLESLLGPAADPSGLAALVGELPGLLSADEMAKIAGRDGDLTRLLRQKLLT